MSAEAPTTQSSAAGTNAQDDPDPAKSGSRDARSLQEGHEGSSGAPHFVTPLSYLRPLSRPATSGVVGAGSSLGGSRPSTSSSKQMLPELEVEQIRGLVS